MARTTAKKAAPAPAAVKAAIPEPPAVKDVPSVPDTPELPAGDGAKVASKASRRVSFKTYLQRLLKGVNPKVGATGGALDSLDALTVHLAETLSARVHRLVQGKTITVQDVESMVVFLLSGSLAQEAAVAGQKACTAYVAGTNDKDLNRKTKQVKASLVFPVSLMDRFLREFGKSRLRITQSTAIFATAVLEHVMSKLLALSAERAVEDKKTRIKNRHLTLAIENNDDLRHLLHGQLSTVVMDGGVVPDIHPFLQLQRPKKRKAPSAPAAEGTEPATKRPHRFRPGTVALRNIKKQQRSVDLQIQRAPFVRACREIIEKEFKQTTGSAKDSVRFSANFLTPFQSYVEGKVVEWFHAANMLAIHSQRQTLQPKDLDLVFSMGAAREDVQGAAQEELKVSDEGIRRLSQRAGVKIVSKDTLYRMKQYMRTLVTANLRVVLQLAKHERKHTLAAKHLKQGLALRGVCLAIREDCAAPAPGKSRKGAANPEAPAPAAVVDAIAA
jgi:histone H3/H4